MALNVGTNIAVTTGGKLSQVSNIQGSWQTVDTISDMNAFTGSTALKSNLSDGQVFYISSSQELYITVVRGNPPFSTYSFDTFSYPGSGGGGTPGGSTTEIQFNDGGAFGGDPRFIFEKTTGLTKLNGSLQITGSTDNIFLIKSGSIDLLRVSSSGAIVFGDLQHTPPPVAGGFFYSSSAFYVGVE